MGRRIEQFIATTEATAGNNLPKIEKELAGLRNRLKTLRDLTDETRKRIDSSIQYYELVDEAKKWFIEGSSLLVTVAKKASTVKAPVDAVNLLNDIESFLKPGKDRQNRRIEKIKELSMKTFGEYL